MTDWIPDLKFNLKSYLDGTGPYPRDPDSMSEHEARAVGLILLTLIAIFLAALFLCGCGDGDTGSANPAISTPVVSIPNTSSTAPLRAWMDDPVYILLPPDAPNTGPQRVLVMNGTHLDLTQSLVSLDTLLCRESSNAAWLEPSVVSFSPAASYDATFQGFAQEVVDTRPQRMFSGYQRFIIVNPNHAVTHDGWLWLGFSWRGEGPGWMSVSVLWPIDGQESDSGALLWVHEFSNQLGIPEDVPGNWSATHHADCQYWDQAAINQQFNSVWTGDERVALGWPR